MNNVHALNNADSRAKLLIALLSVYFIWGSTYLAIRIALEGFPPFMMAGVRFLIAGGGLYLFLRARGVPNPDRSQWKGASLVGGLLLVGGNGGVVYAEQSVASGLAALGVATVPLWMVLFRRHLEKPADPSRMGRTVIGLCRHRPFKLRG